MDKLDPNSSDTKFNFHFEDGISMNDLQQQHESLCTVLNDAKSNPRPSIEYDNLEAIEAVLRRMIESQNYSCYATLA